MNVNGLRAPNLDDIGYWLAACDQAAAPAIDDIPPTTWWRALIIFGYNTGLRIHTVLDLRREMIQGAWLNIPSAPSKCRFLSGTCRKVYLNRFAREALASIAGASPFCFPWPESRQSLRQACRKIQRGARGMGASSDLFGFYPLRCAHVLAVLRVARPMRPEKANRIAAAALGNGVVAGELPEILDRLPQPRQGGAA